MKILTVDDSINEGYRHIQHGNMRKYMKITNELSHLDAVMK